MDVTRGLTFAGELEVVLRDAATGAVVHTQRQHNLVTTSGLTAFAAAINWSGVIDQAANLGITSATQLAPVYGAVGTGSTTPTSLDTQLAVEVGRSPVTQAGSGSGQLSWSFFFGTNAANSTIAEAGVFAGATSLVNSGTMLDHVVFSPTIPKTSAQTMTLSVTLTIANG